MGISMSVLLASDDDLRAFSQQPQQLTAFLTLRVPFPHADRCYLSNDWRELHVMLTGITDAAPLPLGALTHGDLTYGHADPTHALFSATVQRFGEAVQALDAAVLRQRLVDYQRCTYPRFPWTTAAQADRAMDTYGRALQHLCAFADHAAQAQQGFIVCRYEDW